MKGGFWFDTTAGRVLFTLIILIIAAVVTVIVLAVKGVFNRNHSSGSPPQFSQSGTGIVPPQIGPGGTRSSATIVIQDATLTRGSTLITPGVPSAENTAFVTVSYTVVDPDKCSDCNIKIDVLKNAITMVTKYFPLNTYTQRLSFTSEIAQDDNCNVTVSVMQAGSDIPIASQTAPVSIN